MSKTFFLTHSDCEGHDVWEFEETEEGYSVTVRANDSVNPYRKIVMDGDNNVEIYGYEGNPNISFWKLEQEFKHGIVFDLVPFLLLAQKVSGRLLGKCTVVEVKPEVLYG